MKLPEIGRENAEHMIVIESNVEGRDVVGFVEDLQKRIAEAVPLPDGYRPAIYATVEGRFAARRID